jgi:hypothetical protein
MLCPGELYLNNENLLAKSWLQVVKDKLELLIVV